MDFEQIYREYFKDVFLYVRSLTTQEGLAEEITQETFTKALKAIDSYDGKKDIRAWLFTIAKNSFYTHCRQQKHYVEYELPKNCTDDFPCSLAPSVSLSTAESVPETIPSVDSLAVVSIPEVVPDAFVVFFTSSLLPQAVRNTKANVRHTAKRICLHFFIMTTPF